MEPKRHDEELKMVNDCPDCKSEIKFCNVHQKHEQKVYESSKWNGLHDTKEFRKAINDACRKDMLRWR